MARVVSTSADARLLDIASSLATDLRTMLRWVQQEQSACEDSDTLRDRLARVAALLRHPESVQRVLRGALREGVTVVGTEHVGALTPLCCVGPATSVDVVSLAPFLRSAAREWERDDTDQTRTALLERRGTSALRLCG